ncbi:hypothetical protein ACFS7Z_08585 [Pontibacter toksunensis]|uniref:Uncharacterized protein n=1 Tax=Pontibacter toksunensis TaxID=1332631 RepID=A0ABW6BTY5_9BACT
MITLINEQLYKKKDVEIYKGYCPNKALFGLVLQTKEGKKESKAIYKHVFPFFESGKGIVVTTEDKYLWVDTNLNLTTISALDEEIIDSFYQENSRCNCNGTSNECKVCRKGIIRSSVNFKKVEGEAHLTTYEYRTSLANYKITLLEVEGVRIRYEHLWRICDLEDNLQELVDDLETTEPGAYSDKIIDICVYEYISEEGEEGNWLTGYLVKISRTDTSISATLNDDKIYLDLF